MTLATKIHTYCFDTSKQDQAEAYAKLRARLRADGRHCFNVLAAPFGKELKLQAGPIELETDFLFSDQWNSTTARVFDWYEAIYDNRKLKTGHWLEITSEMRTIREKTLVCGFCGKNYPDGTAPGAFCDACLDSPYLKETELHLLRLLPVAVRMGLRAVLNAQEEADLRPRYVERQTIGASSRAVQAKLKIRADVETKHTKATANVEREYRGMIWLLDREISTENCIYYDHTQLFSFGWRKPLSENVSSRLVELMEEFPFPYQIVTESGTLQPSGSERQPGQALTVDCTHEIGEDCINCRKCGKCRETVDMDDVCSSCRN